MQIAGAAFLITAIVTSPAVAQREQSVAPDRASVNGFGARLVVVENPGAFIKLWLGPDIPKVKSAADVTRGNSLAAFILFTGCRTDARDACHAAVDYTIYKPDGTVDRERNGQPLRQEQTAPPPNIQLGAAIPAFRMGKEDPAGEYRVRVKISDLTAKVSFALETRFRLK